MPYLALTRLSTISTVMLRKIIGEINWSSPDVKLNSMVRLSTILDDAVREELIAKNPAELLDTPKRKKGEPDPFTLDEANQIIAQLYDTAHWPSTIYAAFFEFAFFTDMRPQEIIALRWESVGRVLHALEFAAQYAERRKAGSSSIKQFPYVFPPSKMSQYIRQTSDLHKQWGPTLKKLATRYRPPYNCRHTYATICTMSGMNPAFIAQQLGHSVQMLLSTYARWLNSSGDWGEMEKLQNAPGMAQASDA